MMRPSDGITRESEEMKFVSEATNGVFSQNSENMFSEIGYIPMIVRKRTKLTVFTVNDRGCRF